MNPMLMYILYDNNIKQVTQGHYNVTNLLWTVIPHTKCPNYSPMFPWRVRLKSGMHSADNKLKIKCEGNFPL